MFETALGTATVVVQNGALQSPPVKVDVKASAPGILMLAGGSHALAVNYPCGALNAPQNPAHAGEYVTLYLTGQGLVVHAVASGAESPADPPSLPLAAVRAKLGGVNLLMPDIAAGEQSLELTVGDAAASPTVLSVGTKPGANVKPSQC